MMERIKCFISGSLRWLFGGIGRIRHERWEIWMMRAVLAWLVWRAAPKSMATMGQPKPHGIAQFMDVTFISQSGVYGPLHWIFLVALVGYVLGLAWRSDYVWPTC